MAPALSMSPLESLLQLLNQGESCGTRGGVGATWGAQGRGYLSTGEKTPVVSVNIALGAGAAEWEPGSAASSPARCRRKTSSMLEVDDEGGRMFLRVLIHLTMHDYAPLVSGALQLLFKHFSQRQEAMHTFKQVLPPPQHPGPEGVGREAQGPLGPCSEQAASLATHWPALGAGG